MQLTTRRAHPMDRWRSERSCTLAREGMVCASVPSASFAGRDILARGGNAIDAAIAAAAVLCVVEPHNTGLGGDAFALLWSADEKRLVGLNGSGRAPAAASRDAYRKRGFESIAPLGIQSATVPGAVHAWATLHERYGRLPFADLLAPAIRLARDGFPVSEVVGHYWFGLERMGVLQNAAAEKVWAPGGAAPRTGSVFRVPSLAGTLERVAKEGVAGFYNGPVADAIVATSDELNGFFHHDDLAAHVSEWVEPIETTYRGVRVAELPPNGQGITALIGLNILEALGEAPEQGEAESGLEWHRRIEAIKLAFADRDAYVADPEHAEIAVEALLDKGYAGRRAALISDAALDTPSPGSPSDTVYLCASDSDGNMVSFIQSLFTGFGSGVGCGDTGIILQSRGSGFVLDEGHPNVLAPGKRPLHTIIPGMMLQGDEPLMAFGIMGGPIQPQGHLSFVSNVVDHGLNPQEAIDRPRFRFTGGRKVKVEAPELLVREGGTLGESLLARGHEVEGPGLWLMDAFGGGQAIARGEDGVWVGASDRRKDGCAAGLD